MAKIYPRCKLDMAIYVSAQGFVMPCCWLGNQPYFKEFLNFHKDVLEDVNINNHSLEEIVASEAFQRIEKTWDGPSPYVACQKNCGDKPARLEKKHGTNDFETVVVCK